jgi:hypothetical protein
MAGAIPDAEKFEEQRHSQIATAVPDIADQSNSSGR